MNDLAPLTVEEYAQHLKARYEDMRATISDARLASVFAGAKASLLKGSLPVSLRRSMLESYRLAEMVLFGRITDLPGERELLDEPLADNKGLLSCR